MSIETWPALLWKDCAFIHNMVRSFTTVDLEFEAAVGRECSELETPLLGVSPPFLGVSRLVVCFGMALPCCGSGATEDVLIIKDVILPASK